MSRVKSSSLNLLLLVLCWTMTPALAQFDPSSSLLLRSGNKASPSADNLDTQRYKVREPKSREQAVEIDEEKSGTSIPSPVTTKTVVKVKAETTVAPPPVITPAATATVTAETEPEPDPPPVVTQVKELILGGSEEDIAEYKKQIHAQDPRANDVELSIAPAYFYNDTNSSYSFHNHSSHGPGFNLNANLWLTPFFGIQGQMFSSLSSSVRSGATNMIPVEFQIWEAGFRFRKHFGYSRKAPHINFGIDYHENSTKIDKKATDLVGMKASGVSLSLDGTMPTSTVYAHTFGIEIKPRLHKTEQPTAVNVSSGAKGQTNSLAVSWGGQWTLDRTNQVFWRIRHNVEHTLYDGSANTVDPQSGATPDGVSVTNSITMFYFGFRWGS